MKPLPEARSFFLDRFGLTEGELAHVLGTAVGNRADHADLYFEFCTRESLQMEESAVKRVARNVSQGVGVRVIAEDRTGSAYSDEVTLEKLELAATTARAIADDRTRSSALRVALPASRQSLYALAQPPIEVELARKV